MLIQTLYNLDNFNDLVTEVTSIIETAGGKENQIMCQSLDPNVDNWYTGIGRTSELHVQDETAYKYINPTLKNSILANIIQKHNAYRTRIMIMQGRACYSVHADMTKRIHIPIITNNQAWMIWPHHSACYHLVPGYAYLTDTTQEHTFINGSLEKRIHIVMCVHN